MLEWQEPTGHDPAGYHVYKRSRSPYERFIESEGIPIFRGIGVYDNPWDFSDRYGDSDDLFKANAVVEREPVRGRAAIRSNVFPDIITSQLPLDNQRAPGYRRIQPYFHGFIPDASTGGFIAEYPAGRYSKAHYHLSGAVLVCLAGQGYTLNWRT